MIVFKEDKLNKNLFEGEGRGSQYSCFGGFRKSEFPSQLSGQCLLRRREKAETTRFLYVQRRVRGGELK